MKKTTKRLLEALTVAVLLSVILLGVFSTSAASDDPADSYVKQTAANEDSSLSMWFDHSFRKTFTSDTTTTGKDTYSIYMAKNEIESAQVVLYSATDKTNMNIEVTDFTDGKGNTVPAELYYEMYVTTSKLNSEFVLGADANTTFIRAGETPDPIIPYKKLGTSKKPASFKLNAGKSQAFLIRATTTAETPAGWYSAQLNVYDSAGNQVKTATVYCHVWDFVISDETALQTAFYMSSDTAYGGNYKAFYDYLLENRLNAMDVPGGTLTPDNPYLTNPRVTAIRVSETGCGSTSSTMYMDSLAQYPSYAAIYESLSSSPNWESYKDKLYFYTVDEAMAQEQQDAIKLGNPNYNGKTVEDVKYTSAYLERYWPDAQTVVPFHENHPYPYYTYHKDLNTFEDYQRRDATEEMLNTGTVTTWCPQLYAFTPQSELKAVGYNGNESKKIRELSCTISGIYCLGAQGSTAFGASYVNWADQFGEFADRVKSHHIVENENGGNYKLWAYSAGWNKSYSYCNHLIENTGLQTKLLFWQLFQNDITGYLYYGTNNWNEYQAGTDTTTTGAKTTCTWYTNRHDYATGCSIYGNGVLFYGKNMAKIASIDVVGTLRVEIMRDGVEEYQMLKMLSDYEGNKAAKDVVSQVSTNVVRYLSMNNFSTSAWGSADEYDIMETVRRSLGAAVEAAATEGECEHQWNDGTVTTPAGCKTLGEKTYTCTVCGAVKTEYIPAKHTVGDCFTVESSVEATCTEDGNNVLRCTDCGYRKTEIITAFHNDPAKYTYEYKSETLHTIKCSECNTVLNSAEGHYMRRQIKAATCTEEGYDKVACIYCGYAESEEILATVDHNYVDGVCTVCGGKDPSIPQYTPGDVDGDDKITAKDINLIKKMLTGQMDQNEAADVNGDTKLTVADVSALKKILVSG
ncbi:MAG: DUF4091 domain-containing protein [Clostridia bacterium]|nr:DUF4091 domain-containing protein [Clostridia bacterium]